jgi:hypothetical protein
MNIEQIAERLIYMRATYPHSATYAVRFEGGQGPVIDIEIDEDYQEIVFYTGRG